MGRLFESHSDNKDPDGLDAHKPGAKLDAGKPRMALVMQNFGRALALVGRVGTYGANKYTDNGWVFVKNGVERYGDALFRHLLEEEYALQPDPESKIPHAAHAAWNALARLELMLRQELEADSEVWEAPHNVKKDREINEQKTKEDVTWQEFLDSLDEARENDRPESWMQHLRDNLPMNPWLEYLLSHGTRGAAEDAELEKLQEEDAVMRGWKGNMPFSEVEETARLWEEMLDNYYAEYLAGEGVSLPCPYLDKVRGTGWSPSNASVVRWHIRQEAKRRGWVLKTGHKPEIGIGGTVVSKTRLTEALNDPDMNETLAMILREIKGPEPEPGQIVGAEMQEKAISLARTLFSGKSSEVAIVAISENPAGFDKLTDGLRKLTELTKDVPEIESEDLWKHPPIARKERAATEEEIEDARKGMERLTGREVMVTPMKQQMAKALRNIVNTTGVVLDDEHEAMLSNCEAGTAEIGDLHEVWKASETASLNNFWDRLMLLVDCSALTQLEAGKLFDKEIGIAIKEGVFATSQEAALYRAKKVCEKIEAKRRMDAAIADEQRLISREEAIERDEEARRIAEDVEAQQALFEAKARGLKLMRDSIEKMNKPKPELESNAVQESIDYQKAEDSAMELVRKQQQEIETMEPYEWRFEDEEDEEEAYDRRVAEYKAAINAGMQPVEKVVERLSFNPYKQALEDREAGIDPYNQPDGTRFDLIEEGARVLQEAAKADLKSLDEAIAEHNAKQIEAIKALTAQQATAQLAQKKHLQDLEQAAIEERARVSTTAPSVDIHMRPMSIEETEKLDAGLKASGMRRSPEAEAERAERLRLRKLFASMKPALMEHIQLGEGLHESMKGRRFTEEELSDLAELRINEMVSNQMKKNQQLAQFIEKKIEATRDRAVELENQRKAIELELEAVLQKQRDVQGLISEHNQAAIADQPELPPLDLRALSPDELDKALEETLETKRAQRVIPTSWDLKTEALLKERKEAAAEDLEAQKEICDEDDDG